ncbi:TetR/AcrR family transcriptional regulator [Rhodococcus chondri]|uniref:TetR/AcrR family transcriptional regulator n=1 Tax=Rhodococcus chondri TaxID=3065941 RepID=A0ABU7JW91_9NOCA|nr:TetR/AcrR family transcriptional regulator [Rhodococcus sp. CC-R104]MEE2034293.1 TetR/AcrR family transcriptional regulator [Rhodococcus sp. CC-R104]
MAQQPAKGAAGSGRRRRLSLEDWTEAGLQLLVTEGLGAVKISRLCTELGVTKGSFYWHFSDIDELMKAIATHYCSQDNDAARGLTSIEELPVRERLARMATMLVDDRAWAAEAAVRDWARTDPRVAESVRALDQRIMAVVESAFRELGFDAGAARVRAGTLVYAGIGFVYGRDSLTTPTVDEIQELLAVLTRQ